MTKQFLAQFSCNVGMAMLGVSCLCQPVHGQSGPWTGGPTGPIYYNGGNVGIGTTNPGYKLTISGTGSGGGGQTDVQITGTGTVGGGINLTSADTGGKNWALISTGSATGIPGSLGFYDTSLGVYRFVVSSTGNVGIGTTSPQHKLAVNGTIHTKEVIVESGWSDYVFRPGYRLRPLAEISAYIGKHHHLPDIPSESEVKAKGVSVGQMQAKLLAKIEELTLHMIQEHDRNNRLEEQNRKLREQIREIQGRMAGIVSATSQRGNSREANQ